MWTIVRIFRACINQKTTLASLDQLIMLDLVNAATLAPWGPMFSRADRVFLLNEKVGKGERAWTWGWCLHKFVNWVVRLCKLSGEKRDRSNMFIWCNNQKACQRRTITNHWLAKIKSGKPITSTNIRETARTDLIADNWCANSISVKFKQSSWQKVWHPCDSASIF